MCTGFALERMRIGSEKVGQEGGDDNPKRDGRRADRSLLFIRLWEGAATGNRG